MASVLYTSCMNMPFAPGTLSGLGGVRAPHDEVLYDAVEVIDGALW